MLTCPSIIRGGTFYLHRMYNYSYESEVSSSNAIRNMFLKCLLRMVMCAVYILFHNIGTVCTEVLYVSHYFITGSHHLRHRHLHIWKNFLCLTCLTPCFGRCAYVTVLGDDIPMVHAWKQDHCSWTCRSVQTYTHATLRPTVCSALP